MMNCVPIIAAEVDNVLITATPMVTGGITDFTVIYTSDYQLDFTWGYIPPAVNIMIRAKYGSYPDDIPNSLTAPSDGYLIYYGSGTSANDTSVNFEENTGTLYIRAWAQRASGVWYTTPEEASQEGIPMTFIFLAIVAGVLSYLSIKGSNIVLSIVAAGFWFATMAVMISEPPTILDVGSTAQEIVIIALAGAGIGIFITGIINYVGKRKEAVAEIQYYKDDGNLSKNPPKSYRAYIRAREVNPDEEESTEQYVERMQRAHNRLKMKPARRY
jgi:hypothetical protein